MARDDSFDSRFKDLLQEFERSVREDADLEQLKVIRRQIKNGVDNIKLGASGVEVGPYAYTWMTTFSEEEIHIAVEEAHRWGRSVADWHSGERTAAVLGELNRLSEEARSIGLWAPLPQLDRCLKGART